MSDTTSIEREIVSARNALGRQLSEVEEKAKDAIDWRSHYKRNPMPMLAAAAAAGFVISGWLGGDHEDSDVSSRPPSRPLMSLGSPAMNAALAASKYASIPWFATRRAGHIVLQDHNDETYFRNIKIRELNGSTR